MSVFKLREQDVSGLPGGLFEETGKQSEKPSGFQADRGPGRGDSDWVSWASPPSPTAPALGNQPPHEAQRSEKPYPSLPEPGLEYGEEPFRFGEVVGIEPPPFGAAALHEGRLGLSHKNLQMP